MAARKEYRQVKSGVIENSITEDEFLNGDFLELAIKEGNVFYKKE